jgi:hypothetical protein
MPTPKGTGAPLSPIQLVSPGKFGLNTQNSAALLGPEWATEATNVVFDITGRLTARKGWLTSTTSPMSGTPVVDVIHEYIRKDGTRTIISAGGNKVWSGVTAPTDVTGASTITVGDNWQFFNFHDVVMAVQQGEQPLRFTGTGNFADVVPTVGTAPQGNCGLGAFGRVWIADTDKQTIKYSKLLDELSWSGTGSGSIDMTSVWPNGMDEVVALAAYNGALVIFGKNAIVFYRDIVGSALGLNPDNMYVSDTIVGTGCIARDSVQQIDNGDLLFLSANGIQSLQRLIQERSNPILNISMNVRDYLLGFVANETLAEVRSLYAPKEGFYLLILPTSKRVFCLDTRYRLPDSTYRVTEWGTTVKAGCRSNDNTIYLSLSILGGRIGTYTGYNDKNASNASITYDFRYTSGWLELGEEIGGYIKILKAINGIVYTATAGNTMSVTWDFDFQSNPQSRVITFSSDSVGSEWGVGEWGLMEWGGGGGLQRFRAAASGSGQYLKIGVITPIDQNTFALQQMNLYTKIGRLAN